MAVAAMAAPMAARADSLLYDHQYLVDLGVGGKLEPKYPGASDYILEPYPIATVSRFYFPGLGQFGGGGEKSGFSFHPSFNFNGKREPSDSPDLKGTNPVDWALEIGAGGAYRFGPLRGYVDVRQGFNGHHGQVIDFGLDVTARPAERLTLTFGPEATWGSSDYMSTYFGVTSTEAANSGGNLTAYNPGAGFESVGLSAHAEYAITDRTTFHVEASWARLIDKAGDSPIVKLGEADQFTVGVGISRKFAFDLFQ